MKLFLRSFALLTGLSCYSDASDPLSYARQTSHQVLLHKSDLRVLHHHSESLLRGDVLIAGQTREESYVLSSNDTRNPVFTRLNDALTYKRFMENVNASGSNLRLVPHPERGMFVQNSMGFNLYHVVPDLYHLFPVPSHLKHFPKPVASTQKKMPTRPAFMSALPPIKTYSDSAEGNVQTKNASPSVLGVRPRTVDDQHVPSYKKQCFESVFDASPPSSDHEASDFESKIVQSAPPPTPKLSQLVSSRPSQTSVTLPLAFEAPQASPQAYQQYQRGQFLVLKGSNKEVAEGVFLLKKSADQDFGPACALYADLITDCFKRVAYYEKAASLGEKDALGGLGTLCLYGYGKGPSKVEPDLERAFSIFKDCINTHTFESELIDLYGAAEPNLRERLMDWAFSEQKRSAEENEGDSFEIAELVEHHQEHMQALALSFETIDAEHAPREFAYAPARVPSGFSSQNVALEAPEGYQSAPWQNTVQLTTHQDNDLENQDAFYAQCVIGDNLEAQKEEMRREIGVRMESMLPSREDVEAARIDAENESRLALVEFLIDSGALLPEHANNINHIKRVMQELGMLDN